MFSATTSRAIALMLLLCPFARSQSGNGYRDVAFWREPGVQIAYSSFLFRSRKAEEQIPCPVNHGPDASDALGPCHWKSNEFQHLPQWVWVHFPGPRRIDKVVLIASSVDSRPVEISAQYLKHGSVAFHTFVRVDHADFDPRTLTCTIHFTPIITDNIRLVIERSAVPATPQSWFAELAQLQVFGSDAVGGAPAVSTGASALGAKPTHSSLVSTQFVPAVENKGPE
jgi:hypothetical protein